MNVKTFIKSLTVAASLTCAPVFADVDPNLEDYQTTSGISGNISSIGSDTLNNLMTLWAEEFAKFYPNVNIQIQGAGSSTAPPALTEGTANFGPMSREMKSSEIQSFEAHFGYKPTAVPVAIDVVAVYVNKDNPIEGLTMAQVDAIFSATRSCGHNEDITRWGQVGLEGNWENRDFTMYSRNAVSGTYGYFKDIALCGGDFKASINEQPGSASVVQGVSESINGIGYSGIGYVTSSVRALPLAAEEGMPYAPADAEHSADGSYPMARFLYVYINKHPNRDLDPMQAEFLKMVTSKQGQEVVVRDGYIPLPAAVAERVHKELGL
ncbi:phosphate ABC transporter substrate-binding protein PstS family protein [Gilvimarinus agarilyticus]|uniref:PstS family phosphate ABC transporter substrate-binding protein n=1 Tax=Gilvimarinus sp. 2_MG-2023 TaxID=3062666 RepID=UPI001C09D845|nr:phosphate ABC transporter substrate-binding protein PstS family protein [Gilvimarinus sp. 2_MG-2023]MBU2887630.1 phosphate ABC transporter substrate-binding protein PstS family protein [Gilvimarinus agarilyticus]MDO6572281.1 phosphate ABC transporter substrate-binding protein PstS family protein [Gilvimarinus sp. 2_MG-2023]